MCTDLGRWCYLHWTRPRIPIRLSETIPRFHAYCLNKINLNRELFTFVFDPIVLDLWHFVEVVFTSQLLRVFIVENSIPVELIVRPLSIVSWVILVVVEHTFSVHLVLLELSFIICSIFEHQLALTVLFTIESSSFIPASILIWLDCKNKIVFFLLHHHSWRGQLRYSFRSLFNRPGLSQCNFVELFDCSGWSFGFSFKVFDWIEDRLSLRIHKSIFRGFIESAMLELIDILEILFDHLEEFWISE